MLTSDSAMAALFDDFGGASRFLKPPPRLHVDQWADEYRILSTEASSTGGRWRTRLVEAARGPMRAVTEPGVKTISVMGPTQLMKTEIILNAIGWAIHTRPTACMVIQPNEGMAKTFALDRLTPMIRRCPELLELQKLNSRDSANTMTHKQFPGGHVTCVTAQSTAQLASRPICLLFEDEVDKYPYAIGSKDNLEGDPCSIAEERQGTYPHSRLTIRTCSPTVKGISRIEKYYNASDMRKPYVVCQHCGNDQILIWGTPTSLGGVKWSRDGRGGFLHDTAAYFCVDCGAAWSEVDRITSLQGISWRQTRPFVCCGHEQAPEQTRCWTDNGWTHRATCRECGALPVSNQDTGYWASKLYSPWDDMPALVRKFDTQRRNANTLRVFVNTSLAEAFEEKGVQTSVDRLLNRREHYDTDLVPDGVVLVTCGVDVQDDRLEVQVVGWGRDEECWLLDYQIFVGDTEDLSVWNTLDAFLRTYYRRRDGIGLPIDACCVDSGGHRTQRVYNFARERAGRRVFAVRGKSDRAGTSSPVWPRKPTLRNSQKIPLYEVGVNSAKYALMSRLALPMPDIGAFPPGFVHIPAHYTLELLRQLTSERLVTRQQGLKAWQEWHLPSGARNECLDTLIYAYAGLAALQQAGLNLNKEADRLMFDPVKARELAAKLSAAASVPSPMPGYPAKAAQDTVKSAQTRPAPARADRGDWFGGRDIRL